MTIHPSSLTEEGYAPFDSYLGELKRYHHSVYFTRKVVVGCGGIPDCKELMGLTQRRC